MPSWIGQSLRRGLLTTRYPAEAAQEEEVPATARPPKVPAGQAIARAAVDACPVGALAERSVDQGRCVRCARCLTHGLRFDGPVEGSALTRRGLEETVGRSPIASTARAPLAGLGRSLHVLLVDVGSCNACNLEVLALSNPFYDSQRLGIFFTNSPRHADVLVVVGVPTEEMVEPLRRAYEAMPAPKAVLAVGACAISGGAFRDNPGVRGSLEGVVPVDLWVPGCPPAPIQVLDGLLAVAGRGRRGGLAP